MTRQKYQVVTLWLSGYSPVNLKIHNDIMRTSVFEPFLRWKITILNTLYLMKYVFLLLWPYLYIDNQDFCKKKSAYFYFEKELSTKYVKKIKIAVTPYVKKAVGAL